MPISVLYIHHCGIFGGASRSLLELIYAFPEDTVKAHVITQKGKVAKVCREIGVEVIEVAGISQLDHTRFGFYRSARWLILLREVAYIPVTIWAMLKARQQWKKIDIVHVNELTNALAIFMVKPIFRCQLVIHVRSVQQADKGKIRRKLVLWLLKKANAVIAIDSTVRNSLPIEWDIHTIHNGFNINQALLANKYYQESMFSDRPMKIVIVGGLIVMKGIIEFLHAAKQCANINMNVKFVVVGDIPRPQKGFKVTLLNKLGFSYDVMGYCRDYIAEHSLEDVVEFYGFTLNIENVYKDADVLCFPSHLNAAGRPVIEAALFKVPSIVAMRDSAEDVVIHNQTGLYINEKDSTKLFEAVEYFYNQPLEIRRMGSSAFELAEKNFDIQNNARRVLNIYKRCLDQETR